MHGPSKTIVSYSMFRDVVERDIPCVVMFTAGWSGPCKNIKPIFDTLAQTDAEGLHYFHVDIDALPEIAQEANVQLTPTFVRYNRGRVVASLTGANTPALAAVVQHNYHHQV